MVDVEMVDAATLLTVSGITFSLARPRAEDVRLEDIAQGLSLTNRYTGQTRRPYSVAQHAVLVARELRRAGHPPDVVMWGLHHDDAEAYCGDVTRPMKKLLRQGGEWSVYDVVEDRVMAAIAEALGLKGTKAPPVVEQFDKAVGAREQIDLRRVPPGWVPACRPADCLVSPWESHRAFDLYLYEHQMIAVEVARG
jgi:hypothetical protein